MANDKIKTSDIPSVDDALRNGKSRYQQTPVIQNSTTGFSTLQIYRQQPDSYSIEDNSRMYEVGPASAFRPDRISAEAYGSVEYWWMILEANNISGIDELKPGLTLRVPNLDVTLINRSSPLPDLFA